MNAFCTYCSASKSDTPGNIPAIQRYQSERIEKVYKAATLLNIEFYILSGKFGLIPASLPIPFYDHLLTSEEVLAITKLISQQISNYQITNLVYFTRPLSSSKNLLPYHDSITIACKQLSIPFFVIELEETNMSKWRMIMEAAEDAKMTMISDRIAGESLFDELLRQFPRDGMIYFKRGEAYEALGESKLAATDFQHAIALFPMAEWKACAKDALSRVKE